MELINKAENYAAEKTNEVIIKAIAQAYADGYRDGYKDREEEIPIDLRDNKTEYVDLGLPSGTLWAKKFEKKDGERLYLPYEKAKSMNLPTEEQWNELQEKCRWTFESDKIYCTGPNGNCLLFAKTGFKKAKEILSDDYKSYFWIIDTDENDSDIKAGNIFYTNNIYRYTSKLYCGYKLPIRLVRAKQK